MVKFGGVSKNDMTPHLETAVKGDLCVTQLKGTTNVKKTTELLYIQNKVSHV